MDTCAGCKRSIDPAFDSFVRDNLGRPWHTACMTRARGATGHEDRTQGAGPLWAWAIVTVLLPIVGFVVGLVYLFRNRIGPGLALIFEAVALFSVYVVLISSAGAQGTGGVPDVWQRKALALSERVWQPACGKLRIQWADPASYGGTPEWGGWAYLGECTIYEPDHRYWLGYPDFCTAVLHEAGHAAGYGHREKGIMTANRIVGLSHNTIDGRPAAPHWTGVDHRCLRTSDYEVSPRSSRCSSCSGGRSRSRSTEGAVLRSP